VRAGALVAVAALAATGCGASVSQAPARDAGVAVVDAPVAVDMPAAVDVPLVVDVPVVVDVPLVVDVPVVVDGGPRCATDADCPFRHRCDDRRRCVLPCPPGFPTCAGERARSVCAADGFNTVLTDCPDRASAAGVCRGDRCAIACAPGFFDCDDDPLTGCESSTACPSVLLTGFGGSTGYGPDSQCMHPTDDGSYAGPGAREGDAPVAVDLTAAFPRGLYFYNRELRAMYVNANGNVTFAAALATGTPSPFPVADQPMVAPWWADVDTRGGGQPARNNVCFVVQPRRVIVTWDRVGRHDRSDDRANSFQLVVRTDLAPCPDPAQPDIEFRYARCEWSAGDGPGALPAQVGFDAGNRMNFVALPMSRTPAIVDLCRTTNVPGGPPGLFRFAIRGGSCWGNV
jgi:hypothetical protein